LTYARLQQDICDYSADEQQTKSPIPVLRGFLDRVGTSVGGNVGVEAMSQLVKDLGSALRKMKEKDVAFVKAAEKALIAMANSTVPLSSDGMKLVIENVTSGKLTVLRPGRLRFDYNPPSTITIIADGNSVAVIDSKLNTQDVYSIGLTPLKFLLGGTINLARDFKVTEVVNEGERIAVYAEDSSTFGGTSRIVLGFDPKSLVLKQWTVTDPQGYEVNVVLANIDTRHEPDTMQFVIPENPNSARKK